MFSSIVFPLGSGSTSPALLPAPNPVVHGVLLGCDGTISSPISSARPHRAVVMVRLVLVGVVALRARGIEGRIFPLCGSPSSRLAPA